MLRQPTFFISHGGGPWPYMPELAQAYQPLADALRALPDSLPARPRAILMVSAHWETRGTFEAGSHPQPPMIYDYGGFPPHTYDIRYAAPGAPWLAERAVSLLEQAGLPARTDAQRGYDHGAFVPAYVMYPDADMPMAQLSIDIGHDPALHLAQGRALAALRDEGVLIIGSGLSYHNLRLLGPAGREPSAAFDAWLGQTMLAASPAERTQQLLQWEQAPSARTAHAREDHLMPLLVATGAAESEPATRIHHETSAFGAITVSSYRLG